MAVSLIQIPGNIKQQFLPFVLNPKKKNKLNRFAESSVDLKSGVSPQIFSYRKIAKSGDKSGGSALLKFYPSSLDKISIDDDISYKLLYNGAPDSENKQMQSQLKFSDVINCIPGISIREFLPDTRLDQCINMFTSLISEMTKAFTKDENKSAAGNGTQSTDTKSDNPWYKKLMAATWYTMLYMTGMTKPNFFSDFKLGSDFPFANYNKNVVDSFGHNKISPGQYVMKFPYMLYYRLQSCVTTNIYEVPALLDNKLVSASNGYAGWTDGGDDLMSSGGFRVSGLLNKIPVIGSLANMIIGNIGINYMPWWNAESGTKSKEPEINIKFDLFNDNYEAALANFVFVNTIVPNNKWIQYNMFQHSSNLYDVKIEGINRLFACAGDFTVTYDGVLRDPPYSWIKILASRHLNKNLNESSFLNTAVKNRIIKIPDVYHVEMKFQSLLPANFNNFIFAYAQNINHITAYQNKAYDDSTFTKSLSEAVGKYAERVAKVYEQGSSVGIDETKKSQKAIDEATKAN